MKIIVVSDNHGDQAILTEIVERYSNQGLKIFHCGDSELPANDPLLDRLVMVQGNMDTAHFAEYQVVEVGDYRVLVTHGHKYNVNFDLLNLQLLAQQNQADICLFGHTHELMATKEAGLLIVNPGSISIPKGQYANLKGTYAIIDDQKGVLSVNYYNRQHEPIPQLQFEFPL